MNMNYIWIGYAVVYGIVMSELGRRRAPAWLLLLALGAGTWFFVEFAWC